MPISLVYFGSPDFSASLLETLLAHPSDFHLSAVVSNPDRLVGRRKVLTPSPVSSLAISRHLPLYRPGKLDADHLSHLKLFNPDLFVVAAYGKIIPASYLEAPALGVINVHYSLLPKYRGALCVSQAIKNQDPQTGVTIMEMDEDLDHGPIIAQQALSISLNDNTAILTERLTRLAAGILPSALTAYTAWKNSAPVPSPSSLRLHLPPQDQNHSLAVYTPSLKDRHRRASFIPWKFIHAALTSTALTPADKQQYQETFLVPYSPAGLHALIRSLNPDPGAWTSITLDNKSLDLNLIETNYIPDLDEFLLSLVQLPGRNPIPFRQFRAGYPIF